MPPKRSRLPPRLLAAVVAAGLAGILAEGVHSLIQRRSLVWSLLRPPLISGDLPRMAALDEERLAAAAKTEGAFALDIDPFVGARLKGDSRRDIFDAPYTTDRSGHRRRAGPPPESGAFRVVVLGDSVAFGYGVRDDETLGHVLEEALGAAMEPSRPRPVVQTIACPSWCWTSERRHLLDHLGRLDPDLVVLVPIENDLDDPWTVTEAGHPEFSLDPSRGGGVPRLSTQTFNPLVLAAQSVMPAERQRAMSAAGGIEVIAPALVIGFAPESRRRWTTMMDEIGDLEDRLRSLGAHLTLAFAFESQFSVIFQDEIGRVRPGLDIQNLFGEGRGSDTLGYDTHPNVGCIRASARELAARLVAGGRIPGARAASLPAVLDGYAGRRSDLTREEIRRRAAALRSTALRFTGPVIDLRDATGFHQIYGGVAPDGTVGTGLLAALRNDRPGAGRLQLTILRHARKTALYPLSLTVAMNGVPAGSVAVEPPEKGRADVAIVEFPVPDGAREDAWIDVLVTPSNWIAETLQGTTQLSAFRLVSLALR